MRSILVLVTLLCVLSVAQAQVQDNTLRLCGRAFLRAVVYTCGGSRWRRLMGDDAPLPDGSREPKFMRSRDAAAAMEHHWQDLNQGLMTVCCQLGCRKSDLSMLC
ncbi:relaxin-3-like [Thalassophryne amazonica]|uniref:relaxin-3-like n=1 Tax=Thalassophryne amazonica TaxID=390379 RepID=UPI0014710C01|nr:relaxin-3-like [Thalassophryne amazonica]